MGNIGFMYMQGNGVTKNSEKAKEWFQKVADLGDERAKEILKQLQ